MKKLRLRPRKLLYGLLPLPVIFLCGLLTWKWWNAPIEEEAQQLASLDQFFATPRTPLPNTSMDLTSLPDEVGNYKSSGAHLSGNCGTNVGVCFSTTYETTDRGIVWVTVRQVSGKAVTFLQQWSNMRLCDAEQGDRGELRLEAKMPHAYHLCSVSLFVAAYEPNSVIWVNSGWLIEVNGRYEAVHDFIRQYLY